MGNTCLWLDVLRSFLQKTTENSKKFMNIREYSEKNDFFAHLDVLFHMNKSKASHLSTEKFS